MQCIRSIVVLPAEGIMELSWNKVFDKKERREKERRKERRKPPAVSNSGYTTASVKHCNSFGSDQEYLVSIYISKTNH